MRGAWRARTWMLSRTVEVQKPHERPMHIDYIHTLWPPLLVMGCQLMRECS